MEGWIDQIIIRKLRPVTLKLKNSQDIDAVLQRGENENTPRQTSRRQAREIALKAAYAVELRRENAEIVLEDPLITGTDIPPEFTVRLLRHLENHLDQIDDIIREKVERWEFHRIALIDKLILRLGCTELLFFPDVPPKVSINESIEIAKTYSTDKSGRFVNGILDAVYNDLTSGRLVLNGDGRTRS